MSAIPHCQRVPGRTSLDAVPRAKAVLDQAQLQWTDEVADPSLVQNLRAACSIFRLNGREHDARMAEVQLPGALLGIGHLGKATSLALDLFDRDDLPAADRLNLGVLAMMRLAPARHSADFARLLREVTALSEMLSPSISLLHARAGMAIYRLHAGLDEAGVRTPVVSASPGPLTVAPDSVRLQAGAWQAALAELSGRIPGCDQAPARVSLAMCLLNAVAGPPEMIAPAFERFRAAHSGAAIITSWLFEGQAQAWAGRFSEAVDRLDKALELAGTGGRRDLVLMIEFQLASALATLGQVEDANRHALAYFKLLVDGEPSLVQLQAWRRRRGEGESDAVHDATQGNTEPWMRQSEPPQLRRVCDFIARSLSSAITPADLVAASKFSRRSLEVAFRTYRGTTPMRYLKACRLDEAHRLLKETQMPLSEIRLAVGYDSAASFSTDYRTRFGVPPSAVR